LGREIELFRSVHVDLNTFAGPDAADLLMMTTYATPTGLESVRADSRHQEMLDWYRTIAIDSDRREVNFLAKRAPTFE
jgi:hypothetical protein